MERIQLHEFRIPIKSVKKKVIYHFSDSHLTEYDEFSDISEKEKAISSSNAWEGVRKGFCDAYGEPYGELQKQSPKTHFYNLLEAAKDGDALIMAGDILDYVNGANIRLAKTALEDYAVPFIAVCGNHENADDIPCGQPLECMKNSIQILDLGDMVIIGLDDSKRSISREQIEFLKEQIASGRKILLALHVPIMTDGNRELLLKSGVYFQLNFENCCEENLEFIELIRKNSESFIAVLAGHLHYANESEIAPDLIQYVTAQGITGNINKYIIGE